MAGRTRPGLEGTVGYFVNMLPMRAGIADDPPFDEFLARVRRTVADGLEHQDFPFSLMAERVQGRPDPGRSPIFQVMYAHQRSQRLDDQGLAPFALGVPGARLELHGLSVESVALDRQAALFELTLMSARDGDRLRLAWEYSTDLFADRTVESMASGFRAPARRDRRRPGAEAIGPARAVAGGPASRRRVVVGRSGVDARGNRRPPPIRARGGGRAGRDGPGLRARNR